MFQAKRERPYVSSKFRMNTSRQPTASTPGLFWGRLASMRKLKGSHKQRKQKAAGKHRR